MSDFFIDNRIYYHDTDCGGVVYYAHYLRHLEEGRFQLFLAQGIDLGALAQKGIVFPVVHVEVEYKAPAHYGDCIRIFTRLEKIGNSSLTFAQEIKRGEQLLVKAATVWACVDKEMKPQSVPEEIRKRVW